MITDNVIYLPDFQTLLVADRVPLFPDLNKQSNFPGSIPCTTLAGPKVFNKEIKTPAIDRPQHRLDQFLIKPVTASGDAGLVSAANIGQQKLSFFDSPSSAPPQSESSKVPSTNSVFKLSEEIEADIDKLSVLKEAKEHLHCARKRKAPPDKIQKLKSKFHNTKRGIRRSFFFRELEAKLSKEQVARIRNESNKCTPDIKEKHDFVMKHIAKHTDQQLTQKYTLGVLCDAIVYGQNIAFENIEQHVLFLKCKIWATNALQGYSYRKRDTEYIRLLKIANPAMC